MMSLVLCFTSTAQKDSTSKLPASEIITKLIPDPVGLVSDYASIFSGKQVYHLDSVIHIHEKNTTNQLAVVTLDLDSAIISSTQKFEEFSLALFRQWGIGQKGKNNGVLLLISPNLRRVRIEVGYGLETKLTNEEAKAIIDKIIVPEFRKADFFAGTVSAVDQIIKEIGF